MIVQKLICSPSFDLFPLIFLASLAFAPLLVLLRAMGTPAKGRGRCVKPYLRRPPPPLLLPPL